MFLFVAHSVLGSGLMAFASWGQDELHSVVGLSLCCHTHCYKSFAFENYICRDYYSIELPGCNKARHFCLHLSLMCARGNQTHISSLPIAHWG